MEEKGFKAKLACDVSIGQVSLTDPSPKIKMQMHCRLHVGSFMLSLLQCHDQSVSNALSEDLCDKKVSSVWEKCRKKSDKSKHQKKTCQWNLSKGDHDIRLSHQDEEFVFKVPIHFDVGHLVQYISEAVDHSPANSDDEMIFSHCELNSERPPGIVVSERAPKLLDSSHNIDSAAVTTHNQSVPSTCSGNQNMGKKSPKRLLNKSLQRKDVQEMRDEEEKLRKDEDRKAVKVHGDDTCKEARQMTIPRSEIVSTHDLYVAVRKRLVEKRQITMATSIRIYEDGKFEKPLLAFSQKKFRFLPDKVWFVHIIKQCASWQKCLDT